MTAKHTYSIFYLNTRGGISELETSSELPLGEFVMYISATGLVVNYLRAVVAPGAILQVREIRRGS